MKPVLSLLLLFGCLSVLAQQDKKADYFPGISLGVGVSFQKFDGLNSRIANFPQYKALKDATGVLQLGWFKEKKQFISQLNLMAGSSVSGDRDKMSSNIRYLGAGADIGYDFVKSETIALYPLVGIGYQGYQARFFKDNSSVNFDDVVQSPALENNLGPLELTNGFFNYHLGIGVAAQSPKYGSSIGIQALYTGSFQHSDWKSNDNQTLKNAPEDKLSQIYVGLLFTCSPFSMMKNWHMEK